MPSVRENAAISHTLNLCDELHFKGIVMSNAPNGELSLATLMEATVGLASETAGSSQVEKSADDKAFQSLALVAGSDFSSAAVEPYSSPNQQQDWTQYFVQTGQGGAHHYQNVMSHTTSSIQQLFGSIDKPYSGIEPKLLEKAIFALDLDTQPQSLLHTIDETIQLIAKNSIIVQHPNCIAHLHTPPLLTSIVAESIIAVFNQSMDSWDQASAATYVEQRVIDWLCGKYRLGEQSDGVFTSGGTQSNLMGLLLARDWIADHLTGHSVQKEGLPDYAHKLRILCSKKSHFTVQKSASLLGLGERAVVSVECDGSGMMYISALQNEISALKQQGLIPFVVVGTAGTTDHGAIDDLDAIANVAQQHDLWFHVDGAYGGALIFSQHKHRLAGIERADSLSVDFQKLFFQTISCGALLIKDKTNFKYLLHHADYLNREHDQLPNLVDKSIATTRRFDALKVFMTMQSVGPQELGRMYDHLLKQTQQVANLINERPEFELLAEPLLTTVLFRVVDGQVDDLDELNKTLRVEALTRGIAVLGETVVGKKSALKFTILNPCLKIEDFGSLLDDVKSLAVQLVNER